MFEYLQEVQVKTGGIDAEYGGALGGVISAVTKSGGNIFTGEAHYYYIGSGLSAGPVKRLVLDPDDFTTVGYFQDDKQVNNQNEFGGSIGGPIVRNQLFFFGSVSPRVVRRTNEYAFSDGTEPGSIDQEQTAWQGFGKVTYAAGQGARQRQPADDADAFDRPHAGLRFDGHELPDDVERGERGRTARAGSSADQNNVSSNVDLTLGNSGYLSARGGYFYDSYKDTGVPSTTSYTYQMSNIGSAGHPRQPAGPVGTANTPRIQITNFDTTKQGFVQLDYNHAFKGGHLLKGGWGVRRSVNDVDVAYPGGYVYLYWGQSFRSTATGQTGTGTYGYYRG